MATYTGTPRTWAAGETLTAALMNSDVRDPLAALAGAWNSYTPTLTGVTTSSTTGKYVQIGKLVIFGAEATVSAAPSGEVSFSLPVTMATSFPIVGAARLILGASYEGVYLYNNTTTVLVRYVAASTGIYTALGASAPAAWSSGHKIALNGVYEAA